MFSDLIMCKYEGTFFCFVSLPADLFWNLIHVLFGSLHVSTKYFSLSLKIEISCRYTGSLVLWIDQCQKVLFCYRQAFCRHCCQQKGFSAHLSRRLKVSYCRPFLSVAHRPSSINFLHFHLLLENAWLDFNQTWQELSLGVGDSKLSKWYP